MCVCVRVNSKVRIHIWKRWITLCWCCCCFCVVYLWPLFNRMLSVSSFTMHTYTRTPIYLMNIYIFFLCSTTIAGDWKRLKMFSGRNKIGAEQDLKTTQILSTSHIIITAIHMWGMMILNGRKCQKNIRC